MIDSLKMEDGVAIKADPERESSAPLMDEYDYEDTGELSIPREPLAAWLMRIPRPLYESWASLREDEPIQIGHVRQFKNNNRVRGLSCVYGHCF